MVGGVINVAGSGWKIQLVFQFNQCNTSHDTFYKQKDPVSFKIVRPFEQTYYLQSPYDRSHQAGAYLPGNLVRNPEHHPMKAVAEYLLQ